MSRSAGSDAVDAQISMEMLAAFVHALRVQQCTYKVQPELWGRELVRTTSVMSCQLRDFTAALRKAATRRLKFGCSGSVTRCRAPAALL